MTLGLFESFGWYGCEVLPVVMFTLVPRNMGDSASMSSSSGLLIRWEDSDGWSAVEV